MAPTTPTHLSEMVQHIRALGAGPPTPEVRVAVESYLFSKWQGIQVVAGRVLATWGGRESVDALRAWLLRLYEPAPQKKERHWLSTRREVGRCLAKCVTAEDCGWLLALYFSNAHRGWEGWENAFELGTAIAALPADLTF